MSYQLTATIPDDLHLVLEEISKKRGLSLAALAREALLEKYADTLEKLNQSPQKDHSPNQQEAQ